MVALLFSTSLFLSAFLLFSIQPMIAKILLPIYGGTPAVWTLCMLFFQLELLGAYAYVWFISRFAKSWKWRGFHLLLISLSLTAFPLNLVPNLGTGTPDLMLLKFLLIHLGLPLFVVGASAPLLQFAYSQTQARNASDPYFLYSISNFGSLLALLTYPWLIESYLGLEQQLFYWSLIFGFYLLSLFLVFFLVSYPEQLKAKIEKAEINWAIRLRWLSYSFIPCSLMLGLTFYITTDIAATPLFWILPLALYLLSFILVFAKKTLISQTWLANYALFFIIFPILGFVFGANVLSAWQLILFNLICFFMMALLAHGKLVELRPPVNQLTSFYFYIALGGMLAGLFNGLIAPRLFNGSYEYPIVFALASLFIPIPKSKGIAYLPVIVFILLLINYFLPADALGMWLKESHFIEVLALGLLIVWSNNRASFFSGLAILMVFIFSPWYQHIEVSNQQRNFYGVKQVRTVKGVDALISQNTLHGFQLRKDRKNGSLAYYASTLPVVRELQKRQQPLHAIIIGLGTGMMACQFLEKDKLKIIDIDEQVINIAENYFSYLADCPPSINIVRGDGRVALAESKDKAAELLVMDAFSSDAVPTHFLTLEAFKLYKQKIGAKGVILVNISNRHLNLLPVVMAAGRELQYLVLFKHQAQDLKNNIFQAEWVLLTADEQLGMELMQKEGWQFAAQGRGQLWTDDHSNLMPLIKWI